MYTIEHVNLSDAHGLVNRIATENAAAQQAEAKRHARKPHTPTKTKHIELSSAGGSGYSSAYALPAPTTLQPRKL
mgnify:CR=1 FL=1